MTENTNSDKFARIMAVISLAVAICAILVAYLQQTYALDEQKRQFQILQKEDLTVRLNPHVDGSIRITSHDLGSLGRVVQIPWEVSFSNTGNQKLSLMQYSMSTGPSPDFTSYSGIDGGIMTADQKTVKLPLLLEPGESRSFVIYVGILVTPNVYDAISIKSSSNVRTNSSLKLALAKQGMDLYGNHVDYQEFPGGEYKMTIDNENQKSPTFWCKVITGRGNVFLTSTTEYRLGK